MSNQGNKIRFAVLTISDAGARGERVDISGEVIIQMLDCEQYIKVRKDIIPDDRVLIAERISQWSDSREVDVIISTGGTGLGPRDVTPEATRSVIEYEVPGIAEAMRIKNLKITPLAMLSRAVAGVRSGCLIITLPGSPKAVKECLQVALPVIPHALAMIRGGGHPAVKA